MTRKHLCVVICLACCSACGHHTAAPGDGGNKKDNLVIHDTLVTTLKQEGTVSLATPAEKEINALLAGKPGSTLTVVNDSSAKWMKDVFDSFIVPRRKEDPDYPYIAKGDFNGDGRQDAAALVKVKDKPEYEVAIIMGSPLDKNRISFWKEDIDVCAISTYPKGELAGIGSGKVKMKGDGINVEYYEKAAFVLYWNGKEFKRVYTAD
ncbi:MAG: hypothetical protein U0U70_10595 [Chitinophagaceae bacterium]